MSKRKLLTLAMTVAMIAILAIGGSLAYFTDSEQATNVMTIGNVEINIEEHVKNEQGQYDPFVDDQFTLYPVSNAEVGSNWNAHYNKVVRTFNTSPSEDDAYIRTIVLFERNTELTANYKNDGDCCVPGLHMAHLLSDAETVDGKQSHSVVAEAAGTVSVNNKQYDVVVFTAADEQPIPYGEALHAMNAVWMDKNITSDLIDGWGTDGKVDVIVYSQGIQSYDLTHAEAMEALGTVDQALINTLSGATEAAENDYTNN